MLEYWKRAGKRGKARVIVGALALIGLIPGCKTASFYVQAVKGQYQILATQVPVAKLGQDPVTSDRLKERLELVNELRRFAEAELDLPVNGHYQKYADLRRPFVVWNIQAAPEFSMEPKTWWYPVLGRLEYRGYFSQRAATNYANWLRKRGYDVHVGGVAAYSTLGWFKDPLLNTFVFDPEADLAETIFHELGHQRVFAHGDTDFNEAFATTVGQEATRRWLRSRADEAQADYEIQLERNKEFVRLVARTRARLEALYGDERGEDGKIRKSSEPPLMPVEQMRRAKEAILGEFRKDYERLRREWHGDAFRQEWVEKPINNAKLNSIANYYDLVPGFEELLRLNGGDLGKFYAAASELAKKPKKERHEWLQVLAQSGAERFPGAASEWVEAIGSPTE